MTSLSIYDHKVATKTWRDEGGGGESPAITCFQRSRFPGDNAELAFFSWKPYRPRDRNDEVWFQ